jgi:hypothetical protein
MSDVIDFCSALEDNRQDFLKGSVKEEQARTIIAAIRDLVKRGHEPEMIAVSLRWPTGCSNTSA